MPDRDLALESLRALLGEEVSVWTIGGKRLVGRLLDADADAIVIDSRGLRKTILLGNVSAFHAHREYND